MKKSERRLEWRWQGAVAVLLVLTAGAATACTGMYVGKGVSADGTALLGRTVDLAPWVNAHRYVVIPRVENVPGRTYRRGRNKFCWNLPATTWKFVSTPAVTSVGHGSMDSACVNERGLAVTGTVTAHPNEKARQADPFNRETGPGENSLPGLLAMCCSTAREAIDLLAETIARLGHENGEIYQIADADEAWYVEVYTGHQWAAVRMPEDKVSCWGNQFMIRSFDPSSPDTRSSPELVSLAEKGGFLVRGADGLPDLCRTYSRPLGDYANYRTWFGHHVLAPETAGAYATDRPMALFFSPARKVGYRDLFELMRARYEGTDHDPDANRIQNVRVIGTTKQATSHVISIDSSLPAEFRCTIWASLANCEHSVFQPLNAAIACTASAYAYDQETKPFRYDRRIAGMEFRRLCALAEQDRHWYGRGVRAFWRAREDQYLREFQSVLKRLDAKRLTEWTIRTEEEDLASSRRVFDELMWYVAANNRIAGDGSGATAEPTASFRPSSAPKKSARRPLVIGVSERYVGGDKGEWTSVKAAMTHAVMKSGNIPLIISHFGTDEQLGEILDRVDALIMTGGEDIAPARYGEQPEPKLGRVSLERDVFDLNLIRLARERRLPILGICRGEQALNVAFGGTLHQDIPTDFPGSGTSHRSYSHHSIRIDPCSRLAAALNRTNLVVNSAHHQCVKRIAPGFRAVAWAPDGVIEAIESTNYPAIGLQFHPETMIHLDGNDAFLEFLSRIDLFLRQGQSEAFLL